MGKYSLVGTTHKEVPLVEKYLRSKLNNKYLNISANGMESKYLTKESSLCFKVSKCLVWKLAPNYTSVL